jgi:hypothetical protein
MWEAIIGFLGGPVVKGLLAAYNAKLKAATDDKTIASGLAADQIAAETASGEMAMKLKVAQIGHPFEPEKLAFYVVLIYFAKCLLWDKVLGLGSTDPVTGAVGVWANLVMSFYFGKRTIENVTTIVKAFR